MTPPPKEVHGLLLIICGPTGTGKTTLRERLVVNHRGVESIITCTTRPPRGREKHGVDYFFLSNEEFDAAQANGEFLESAQVHLWRYGTKKCSIFTRLEQNADLVVNIDVQGARAYRQAFEEHAGLRGRLVTIFVMPPDMATIYNRLLARGQDSKEQIARRMETALYEVEQWTHFDYCIVTGSKDDDYARLESIWRAEKCRVDRLRQLASSAG